MKIDSQDSQVTDYSFCGYTLQTASRQLIDGEGNLLPITARAFDCLMLLVQNHGRTLSKSELIGTIWEGRVVEENNLSQAIFNIRKTLNDPRAESQILKTIPGRGYCFIAPVTELGKDTSETQHQHLPSVSSVSTGKSRNINSDNRNYQRFKQFQIPATGTLLALFMLTLIVTVSNITTTNTDNRYREMASGQQTRPIHNSLAVLPFTSLNPDSNNELFVLGLQDELINQLSRISSLNVISRSSILNVTSQQRDIREIGEVLNVESIISGTVFVIDDQARINLSLIDPYTGISRWSEKFEVNTEDLTELLMVQGNISAMVAQALEAEIVAGERMTVDTLPTHSFEAYRYLLAARNAYITQNFAQAKLLSSLAIELDPEYYDALQLFSNINAVLMGTPLPGFTTTLHYELALQTAEQMISLQPDRGEGYILKSIALSTNGEWEAVAREINRLNDMSIPVSQMNLLAPVYMALGNFDEAIRIMEANLRADPLNQFGRGFLMAAYEANGQEDKAREEYRLGEELSPVWWGDTINVFLQLGRNEVPEDIDDIAGISADLKNLLKQADNREYVLNRISEYSDSQFKIPANSLYYAALAAYHDQHDMALKLMSETLQKVSFNSYFLWLPLFAESRQTPAFKDILLSTELVGYWEQNGWPAVCSPDAGEITCH